MLAVFQARRKQLLLPLYDFKVEKYVSWSFHQAKLHEDSNFADVKLKFCVSKFGFYLIYYYLIGWEGLVMFVQNISKYILRRVFVDATSNVVTDILFFFLALTIFFIHYFLNFGFFYFISNFLLKYLF